MWLPCSNCHIKTRFSVLQKSRFWIDFGVAFGTLSAHLGAFCLAVAREKRFEGAPVSERGFCYISGSGPGFQKRVDGMSGEGSGGRGKVQFST